MTLSVCLFSKALLFKLLLPWKAKNVCPLCREVNEWCGVGHVVQLWKNLWLCSLALLVASSCQPCGVPLVCPFSSQLTRERRVLTQYRTLSQTRKKSLSRTILGSERWLREGVSWGWSMMTLRNVFEKGWLLWLLPASGTKVLDRSMSLLLMACQVI